MAIIFVEFITRYQQEKTGGPTAAAAPGKQGTMAPEVGKESPNKNAE
jgi:hypothetical protein